MPDAFHSLHINAADAGAVDMGRRARRTLRSGAPSARAVSFRTDEAAARFHLSDLLENDEREALRSLTTPDSPQLMPDLKLRDGKRSPLTRTTSLRFTQTHAAVPVFGAGAVVELGKGRNPLAVDAQLATVQGTSHLAALSEAEAMNKIADFVGCQPAALAALPTPTKTFYWGKERQRWHLAWYIRDIPGAPPEFFKEMQSHGPGPSVALRFPRIHALVDAHDGTILLYWSAYATLVRCTGIDEDGVARIFYGSAHSQGSEIELKDPLRRIRTFDLRGNEYMSANAPADPIRHANADFSPLTAAVTAHFNTGLVSDFFRSILKRDSIDDTGMEILSYINCTDHSRMEWPNAAWADRKIWFGSSTVAGRRRSFARHLDLIAHELSHGVVEFSAGLVYRDEAGALDESFCDIFAVLIKNWDWNARDTGGDTTAWSWSIGDGLGAAGGPMRDLGDPSRTGMPDHMRNFYRGPRDSGGVHRNCNIHNKAAYNVLTATDANGRYVLTPMDCAVLYYLALSRLNPLATFSELRATLLNVAGTYFLGAADRQGKLDAVADAYERVGIR